MAVNLPWQFLDILIVFEMAAFSLFLERLIENIEEIKIMVNLKLLEEN